MPKPSHDPSIEHEPHLAGGGFQADGSEQKTAKNLAEEVAVSSRHDRVEHTVWDEPARSGELTGPAGEDAVTFARWYREQTARVTWYDSLLLTFGVALFAGPWGVLGALMSGGGASSVSLSALFMVGVVAPVTEEITKIAAALWVVEKRPYWFKSVWQILVCTAASGAMFAAIENLLYLYVYFPHADESLAAWRWTTCVGLHMNCSVVAGVGVARIWHHTDRTAERPQLTLGSAWFALAMAGHGAYNIGVTIAEVAGWLELG